MPSKYVPPEDHLVRYIPFSKLISDSEGRVLGILGEAFRLRPGEKYLSATWAEFHELSNLNDDVFQAIRSFRKSMKTGKKSAFSVGQVGGIDRRRRAHGSKVRFIHEPEDNNPAHAALRQWPEDAAELFDRLATEEWSSIVLNQSVPP